MVKELSLWPPHSVTTEIEFPSAVPFCSKGLMQNLNSCFQPTGQPQMPPGPLLSESGGMLLYLSDAFSLVTQKAFPNTCHYPSMQQLAIHKSHLKAAFLPLWHQPKLPHSEEPSSDPARVSCCDHTILVVISLPWFSVHWQESLPFL